MSIARTVVGIYCKALHRTLKKVSTRVVQGWEWRTMDAPAPTHWMLKIICSSSRGQPKTLIPTTTP